MFDFFDKIIGFFETIWTLVLNLIDMLFTFIGVLLNVVTLPAILTFIVPGVIGTSLVVIFSFAIIKLVVNR